MSALQDVIKILSDSEFAKGKQTYFLLLDDLDEQWAEDELRYRLIRALIEVVKRFRTIRCVKIIVALRTDLLFTVLEATRDSGFQEEKFDDFFLRLKWSDTQLKQMVGLRVSELVRHKYKSATVGFYDVFPKQVRQTNTLDYILKRTLKRPRDAILFVNQIFTEASGRTDITPSIVQESEPLYSQGRVTSLAQEWYSTFPQLSEHIDFLKGLKSRQEVSELPVLQINRYLLTLYKHEGSTDDPVTTAGLKLSADVGQIVSVGPSLLFLRTLFGCLYRVGAVGIRKPGGSKFVWNDQPSIAAAGETIDLESTVAIHPMLYAALGVTVLPDSE